MSSNPNERIRLELREAAGVFADAIRPAAGDVHQNADSLLRNVLERNASYNTFKTSIFKTVLDKPRVEDGWRRMTNTQNAVGSTATSLQVRCEDIEAMCGEIQTVQIDETKIGEVLLNLAIGQMVMLASQRAKYIPFVLESAVATEKMATMGDAMTLWQRSETSISALRRAVKGSEGALLQVAPGMAKAIRTAGTEMERDVLAGVENIRRELLVGTRKKK